MIGIEWVDTHSLPHPRFNIEITDDDIARRKSEIYK